MPTLYLAFANHSAQPLENLQEESREVYARLHPRKMQGHYGIHREEFLELDTMAQYLSSYRNDIYLFHFAGHASQEALLLSDREAGATGIGTMLARQENLGLVFLNGCSTKDQVAFLLDKGVPAVIATSAPINDTRAKDFAVQFYQALADGHDIGGSFDMAQGYALAREPQPLAFHRGIAIPENIQIDTQHWGLYVRDEHALEWTLPDQPLNIADMIDPATLAAAAIAALTPYLAKGGEALASGIGKDLWELVKKPFKSDGDKKKLEELETKPEDRKTQGKVEGKLEELLAEDAQLAAQLAELLRSLPKSEGKTNTQTISGTGNIGIQDVSGGSTIKIVGK